MYDILTISNPKIVALNLSEKEYKDVYSKIQLNPHFPETMRKVETMLKNKDPDITNLKEIDL